MSTIVNIMLIITAGNAMYTKAPMKEPIKTVGSIIAAIP